MEIVPNAEMSADLNMVNMVCYRSFEQAALIKDQWDKFVEHVGADLYSSFDWCEVWWKHFGKGRQLEIYVAKVGEKTVAILPTFREKISWGPFSLYVVRFVGCDHLTTFCGFAVDADWVVPVAKALVSQLNQNQVWDVIHIGELAGYCENAKSFAKALCDCEGIGSINFGNDDYPHMVFEVPDSFEEYLKKLSKCERHHVKHDERVFSEKEKLSWCLPHSRAEFEQAISRLIEFHTKQWNKRGRLGHFGDWPGVEAFHREIGGRLLDSGKLFLVEVYQNGNFIASKYGGKFGSRAHWIVGTRAVDISGRVGFSVFLRSVIADSIRQIDSLGGYYDYKRRLGARVLGLKNITAVNRRNSSWWRFKIMRNISWLMELIYWRLWFWHLAPWMRQKWPILLKIKWLRKGAWDRFIRSYFLLVSRNHRSIFRRFGVIKQGTSDLLPFAGKYSY